MKPDLEAFTCHEANGKAEWIKIGAAYANEDEGFLLFLDAIPAPTEDRYKIALMPVKEKPQDAPEEAA